ncbi:MAG: hypothetical protein HYW69_01520 [Candidatus Nealsonbacteria bacterium]|nr:hypothetical protein [Candidatus Nealsonbacteria bacterium]
MGDSTFEKIGMGVVAGLVGVLIVVFFAVLFALPIMWLWNWLMPTIFDLPRIGFLQALGLNILSGFLIKGGKW